MTSLASVLPFLGAKNVSSAKKGVKESSSRAARDTRKAMEDGSCRHQLSPHVERKTTRGGPAFGRSQTTSGISRRGGKDRDRMGESERRGGRMSDRSTRRDRMGESERRGGRMSDRSSRRKERGSASISPVPELGRTRTVSLAVGQHKNP